MNAGDIERELMATIAPASGEQMARKASVTPITKAKKARAEAEWRGGLILTKSGKPKPNLANAIKILGNTDWKSRLAWNAFSHAVVWDEPPRWIEDAAPDPSLVAKYDTGNAEFGDVDATRLAAWFSWAHGVDMSPEMIWRAVVVVAQSHVIHPVREYLDALEWDGTPRAGTWLSTYAGAEDTPYTRRVGTMVLVSAVARVMQPGCKVDTMLVAEGGQGIGKSSLIRAMFGAHASDTPPDLQSKDRFMAPRGRWCIEWSELDGMHKGDTDRLKSYLSSAIDDFRPPYGRANVQAPRQCIFIGTTNGDAYLKDATGGRRFWPVRFGSVDVEGMRRDRDQLWAEAIRLYRDGVTWWPSADESALFTAEQEQRLQVDAWQSAINAYLAGKSWVQLEDVLARAVDVELSDQDPSKQLRAVRCMQAAGWEKTRRRVKEGEKKGELAYGYVPRVPPVPTSTTRGGNT